MMDNRPQAILFGLALGDALGYPVEFLKLEEIKRSYSSNGIQHPPSPCIYSDDTQMTIALTEGVLDAGLYASIDDQMNAIGRLFIDWLYSPDDDRAPGTTCMNGVERYEQGMSWHVSGILESKGCGSAMRVATLGYFYQNDDRRLREIAAASSLITHGHPTAIAASVAAAYLVKLALDELPLMDYLRCTSDFVANISNEFNLALIRVNDVLAWDNEELALERIGQGWTGEEAVALALYCVLRYPDDFVACVRRAANINGDSDSVASIAGGIIGARLGLDSIPAGWLTRCENADRLADLGHRMTMARDLIKS